MTIQQIAVPQHGCIHDISMGISMDVSMDIPMDISMDRPTKMSIHAIFNYAVSITNSNGNYQMYDHVLPSSFVTFFVLFLERNSKCMTTYCLIVAGSTMVTLYTTRYYDILYTMVYTMVNTMVLTWYIKWYIKL